MHKNNLINFFQIIKKIDNKKFKIKNIYFNIIYLFSYNNLKRKNNKEFS